MIDQVDDTNLEKAETVSRSGSSTEPYQVFDRLPPDKYAALREDIQRRGILVPIEVDDDGNILDGHNRAAIAQELNISYEPVKRSLTSEKEKIDHVLKSNLLRRNVGIITGQKLGQYHRLKIKPVTHVSHPHSDFSSPLS